MALSASSVWSTFDRGTSLGDTAVRDVSPLMFAALNTHPGTLVAMIKKGDAVSNRVAEWVEQALNPGTVTMEADTGNVDGSASNTTFGVAAGTAASLEVKVGDLLKNKSQNIAEVLQVTAVNTDDFTVTRGFGSTSGSASHADGNVFEIIPAAQEGSGIGSDRTKARTTRLNRTQIFDTAIKISRTMMNTAMYNVPDEFANSLAQRTIELKNRLNYAMINGIASAAPSDSVYGTMGGIIEMISTGGDVSTPGSAGSNVDSSTTSLTYDSVSDLIGTIAYTNGNRDGNFVIATGQAQYENIATWPDGQIRRQFSTSGMAYGGYVDTLVTKQGLTAKVILEPDMPIGNLAILDLNRIELCPLQNSAMLMYIDELGVSGNDYKQARLVAEWTLKMHNADKAHGLMTALT